MARYRRLTLMEREEVSRMLAAGYSLRATGQALNRAPSTLSRELSRHHASPVTYRAVRAHQRARRWAHRPRKPRKLAVHPRLRTAVFALLAQRWPPEQLPRARTAYAARPTAPLAHLRPGPRDVRAPSLHGADEDSGLLRTSALPLGAGNQ